ncbi:MAG: NADH-quinone oxidoreductase subunit C [Candidatus Wallbacteria bacterium]|nr:NADH-quinone oxidoreductase subunit C [Candidatus Wallbacteria bacterium]
MAIEEKVKQELSDKFPFLKDSLVIKRARRIFVEVPPDRLIEVVKFAHSISFTHLCTITGLDEGTDFAAIYHLSGDAQMVLNLKIHIPKDNPVIQSITGTFPGGHIYERELEDMLGIKVANLPPGRHYPLPEDWPSGEYPLRKNWQPKNPAKADGGANV